MRDLAQKYADKQITKEEKAYHEQELVNDIQRRWLLECIDQCRKYKEKMKMKRLVFNSRRERLSFKLRLHLVEGIQQGFIDEFKASPGAYYEKMRLISTQREMKKRKELGAVIAQIEQYDFFFKDQVLGLLSIDQHKIKHAMLRSIIRLNFEIPKLTGKDLNYFEKMKQKLDEPEPKSNEQTQMQNSRVAELLDFEELIYVNGSVHKTSKKKDDEGKVPEKWEQEQKAEIQAVCHFEFRMFEVLRKTLESVELHLRGISGLWGKDLDVVAYYLEDGSAPKANMQDTVTYEYLTSLANFLACERVSLDAFRNQLVMNVTKAIKSKLEKENQRLNGLWVSADPDQKSRINEYKEDYLRRAGKLDVPIEEQLKLEFGEKVFGGVLKGDELCGFEKYCEFIESANYVFYMHITRMTLLMKLINKSVEIRRFERDVKQKKAQSRSGGDGGIETDLFQINQVLKNEVGKDVDMIENFLQESLKGIYTSLLQYLQNVPQDEPDFKGSRNDDGAPPARAQHESLRKDSYLARDNSIHPSMGQYNTLEQRPTATLNVPDAEHHSSVKGSDHMHFD